MLHEKIGAFFAVAVFWHFVADWLFQSHAEAMSKTNDWRVRAWHCLKYTFMFMFPIKYIGFAIPEATRWTIAAILFMSHFIIDTYVPVMLWAQYLRRDPNFRLVNPQFCGSKEAFRAMASTPIGLILIITMDQLFHIAFLLPVVTLLALHSV